MNRASTTGAGRTGWGTLVAGVVLAALAACGGGGGGGGSGGDGTPTTVLPPALAVAAPSGAQSIATAIAFSSNAPDAADVRYRWDFGDGATSTDRAPTHAYAKPGLYAVMLTVANGDGDSVLGTAAVAVSDFAIVQGKVCSGPNATGWCWQQPLPQGNPIAAYAMPDDTHVFAVGARGTVLSSADFAATWQGRFAATRTELRQVAFVDARIGWAAGENGEVLRTADGGTTWRRLSTGSTELVATLGASDALTAWVTLSGTGVAIVTRDGGATWQRIAAPVASSKAVVVSAGDVWATPYDASLGLRHTVDAGATWTAVAQPPIEAGFSTFDISLAFADASHAVLVRLEYGVSPVDMSNLFRQTAWLTADRGATWRALAWPGSVGAVPSFRYPAVGTVYAFDSSGPVARTTDDGATWQAVVLPNTSMPTFYSRFVAFAPSRLLATDYLSRTFLSIDGGATWREARAESTADASWNSVWFFDTAKGLVVDDSGAIGTTTDGGRTWTMGGPDGTSRRRLQFLADASLGWLIADGRDVLRTADRGATFSAPAMVDPPMAGVADLHFVDASHGWAVAPFDPAAPEQSRVWITGDGGVTWRAPPAPRLGAGAQSVRFADALHGVVVTQQGIAYSSDDGGLTWTPRATGAGAGLERVTFADASTAVAVGPNGGVFRSSDQGRSWSTVAVPATSALVDVRFLSAARGHAVGDDGTVLATTDAGLTWTALDTGTRQSLRAVFFTDPQTGWVAGGNGAILATATGGR